MPVQTSESERIAALEAELAEARARAENAERALAEGGVGGFGVRAERLLRLAEVEAREMRGAAAADVTALIAKAQAEAEAHRHEVEQQLIERSTAMDRLARDRQAAFTAREQEMNAQLDSRRAEGERLRNAALGEAERIRRDAQSDAARMREAAEVEGRTMREAATTETDRLGVIQQRAREQLARLDRTLGEALATL
jgi:hypothetical protein